jgi:acyl-CoA thioester hydrolase
MKTVECKIRVRYSETGRQGYAHHTNFFNWFDIGLEEIIKICGSSYREIEDLGYFLVPISDSCKYYHPASYNDVLTIRVTVADLSSVKVKFSYEIIREKDSQLVATGQTDHVFVDKNFRPYSLKKVMPRLFALLKEMAQPQV